VACKDGGCSESLDPQSTWSASLHARVRDQATGSDGRTFPQGRERLCITVNRDQTGCCCKGEEPPCTLRLRTSDILADGQGLRVVLWGRDHEVAASAARVRSDATLLPASTERYRMQPGDVTYKPGARLTIERLELRLRPP
jgi:hypothetical protein